MIRGRLHSPRSSLPRIIEKFLRSLREEAARSGLGRMLPTRRSSAGVRNLLAQLYDWFTEGFDTADLKDATSLPDELGT